MYKLELYISREKIETYTYATLREAVEDMMPSLQCGLVISEEAIVQVYEGPRYCAKNSIVLDDDGMPYSSLIKLDIIVWYNNHKKFRWIFNNIVYISESPEPIEAALGAFELRPENYIFPVDIDYHITVTRGTKSETVCGKDFARTLGKMKRLWQLQYA